MTVNVNNGSSKKPVATQRLVDELLAIEELEGELFTGFPILPGIGDIDVADALLVSPTYGAIVFDIVEGTTLGEFKTRQDDLARMVSMRLLEAKGLAKRGRLTVDVHTVTYAPAISPARDNGDDDYPLANRGELFKTIVTLEPMLPQQDTYEPLLSSIHNLATMKRSRTDRNNVTEGSRGARLKQLEDSIATLDHLQSRAVIESVDGVQRLRGLAGSGKTVVLALKAAYLHALHPEWRIAVTFNTRSLKEQFRRLINDFTISQTRAEPDWTRLRILQAWGSPGSGDRAGVYSIFCEAAGTQYFNFRSAAAFAGANGLAFDWACETALNAAGASERALFDAILVDEAQDLPPEFLRMCYLMLDENKRLVYAYDELQSLEGRGVPSPDEIFGSDRDGTPLVDLVDSAETTSNRDIVLQKCYRNSRPILVAAHAVGFGVYRQPPAGRTTGLVQMFGNEQLWTDIGYEVKAGFLREDSDVTLARTEESSPAFLEQHSKTDDLVVFRSFTTAEEQNSWVAEQIRRNLDDDELRHDDIVVINPNGITARNNLAPLRSQLLDAGIANHLAGVDTSADVFFDRDSESVTFTGIHRAKGNEAGMVYIVNAQEGLDALTNQAAVRNRLFTAITRSKAWVRIVGVGPNMDALVKELEETRRREFVLQFHYPTEAERARINLVHREISPEQERKITEGRNSARQLLDNLENAQFFADDLDPEVRERLRSLLGEDDG
ncbi:DEAD/DEAH box helicase [Demequina sp. NBRC 110052]|uniref:DEAD/DEAH box helicase n=1 Tax=Demequina sp. NBRC 110052 TaxID=1570341 RepID=UPI000A02E120|nr:ATP-binding domain-containing protein [Demequina sp. NBRC 110052]